MTETEHTSVQRVCGCEQRACAHEEGADAGGGRHVRVVSATTAGSSEGVYAEALLHENNMQRLYPVDKQVLGS